MDRSILLAGLPVTIALGAGGIYAMLRGWTVFGLILLAFSIVATMFIAGEGLPRPDVVARPGEEGEYDDDQAT